MVVIQASLPFVITLVIVAIKGSSVLISYIMYIVSSFSYHDKLEVKQKENFALSKKLREKLEALWERLSIPEMERRNFNSSCTGFKPSVIDTVSLCRDFSTLFLKMDSRMAKTFLVNQLINH